jgi:hypothetical protein
MAVETDETVVLMQAMAKIRAKRRRRLSELSHETERLTDWREYVKSAPIAAVSASAVAGFVLAGQVVSGSSKAESHRAFNANQATPKEVQSGIMQSAVAGALAIAVPMVTMAIRRYAVEQFFNLMRNPQHEPAQPAEREPMVR